MRDMEGIYSYEQLSLSYQRLTLAYYQGGQVTEQQQLEGQDLKGLADQLMNMPGEDLQIAEGQDPFDAMRQQVGSGTAVFIMYEEIHLEFTRSRFEFGNDLSNPEGMDDANNLLDRVDRAVQALRRSFAGPQDTLRGKMDALFDRAFNGGRDRIEDLGDTTKEADDSLHRLFGDLKALLDKIFASLQEPQIEP
ncbi:MAG: hypothetical protein HYY13_05590 [Nitrospirae bacterium]|nr:hypothetical protein [Nitrospirota bacterium]